MLKTILTYLEGYKTKEYQWTMSIWKQAMISCTTQQWALRTTIPLHSTFKLISFPLLHGNQARHWFLTLVKSSMWGLRVKLVRAFDIATIDCVVGRIKVSDRWGIIDRSFGSERAVMHGIWEPEYKSEDEND